MAAGTLDAAGVTALGASQAVALDKISRIDGVYSEFFHNETKPFNLDSRALFTEFYFDLAEDHRLTLGLRYTEDQKEVHARATFYDTPLVSAWSDATQVGGAAASTTCATGGAGAATVDNATGIVTPASNECLAIGATVGQAIGSAPVVSFSAQCCLLLTNHSTLSTVLMRSMRITEMRLQQLHLN